MLVTACDLWRLGTQVTPTAPVCRWLLARMLSMDQEGWAADRDKILILIALEDGVVVSEDAWTSKSSPPRARHRTAGAWRID